MFKKSAFYYGYTLAEILVVLMIVIILGGMGAYSFSGLRDTILVKQNIEEIKQDMQLVQQKAMLIEKRSDEGWIYGIGIDFSHVNEGRYTFFKWCSPFPSYGDPATRSEIIAYNPDLGDIGYPLGDGTFNGILPTDQEHVFLEESFCDPTLGTAVVSMPGLEEGKINAGFNIGLLNDARYVVFEAVTGRVFLYKSDGWPINYNESGEYDPAPVLGIVIMRNQGQMADVLQIGSLSGAVTQSTVKDPEILEYIIPETPIDLDPVPDPTEEEPPFIHPPAPIDLEDPIDNWILPVLPEYNEIDPYRPLL